MKTHKRWRAIMKANGFKKVNFMGGVAFSNNGQNGREVKVVYYIKKWSKKRSNSSMMEGIKKVQSLTVNHGSFHKIQDGRIK